MSSTTSETININDLINKELMDDENEPMFLKDTTPEEEQLFIVACYKNNITLAKQLLGLFPNMDIFAENGKSLKVACDHHYYELAEWLISMKPKKEIASHVFSDLCYHGHFESAKWLHIKIPTIDVTARNNRAFRWTAEFSRVIPVSNFKKKNLYFDIAKWLMVLKPNHYIIELDSYGYIYDYWIRELNDIKWLERRLPLLAFCSKYDNAFKQLNFDVIREICLFIQ